MTKKLAFVFWSSLNIVVNLLLIRPFNQGEVIFSNLLLIGITLVLLSTFSRVVDNSWFKLEFVLLITLTILSIIRMLYRINIISGLLAIIVALIAFITITVILLVGIARWKSISKNWVIKHALNFSYFKILFQGKL